MSSSHECPAAQARIEVPPGSKLVGECRVKIGGVVCAAYYFAPQTETRPDAAQAHEIEPNVPEHRARERATAHPPARAERELKQYVSPSGLTIDPGDSEPDMLLPDDDEDAPLSPVGKGGGSASDSRLMLPADEDTPEDPTQAVTERHPVKGVDDFFYPGNSFAGQFTGMEGGGFTIGELPQTKEQVYHDDLQGIEPVVAIFKRMLIAYRSNLMRLIFERKRNHHHILPEDLRLLRRK